MKFIKRHFFIFLLFICATLSAQNKKVVKAYAIYNAGEYYNAIELLKDAYDYPSTTDPDKKKIIFYIGECYRKSNQPVKAELWYSKALKKGADNPIIHLYYANALKQNEKYDDAVKQYEEYKELMRTDERADNGIRACKLIQDWMANPNGYIVENAHFFNTKESEFAPAYGRDDYNVIYFTSSRKEALGEAIHGATGEKFPDIFESKRDKEGKWSIPTPLDENINTEFSDGTPSLSANFSTLFFTRCEKSKSKIMGCALCTANRDGETWSKAEGVKIEVNDSAVIAHPAISPDGNTLYFTANLKDGIGGKDIWYVVKNGGDWSAPVNMGSKINTKGNEVFPYVHADGTLYFASDGHLGMGGLDIFKAEKLGGDDWKVQNMGYPMNSKADDFAICFEKEEEKGFFASSRGSGANDDIYSFVLPPIRFNVTGKIKDENTLKPIGTADIKVIGSDGFTMEARSDKDGNFKFMLKPATDYVFIASAEDYLKGKNKLSTKGETKSKDFSVNINLPSIERPIEISNIYYDFAKWSLRPESMVSLDRLVEVLNENPNITIELMAHSDYIGSDETNLEVSQKRAQSVVDYLIDKGIAPERMIAKGYGESMPKQVDQKINEQAPFFEVGKVLTEQYILALPSDDYQEIAKQINRRTEFKVLSTDYKTKRK